MSKLKYEIDDTVTIHEGEGEGETGIVIATKEGNFGKQWLTVHVKVKGAYIRYEKRASDVTLAD